MADIKKVLVVEDEEAFRKLIHDQLIKDGYEVLEAEDGKKGYDAALSKHPDLILLDLKLPIMDGLEVLEKIRADGWGSSAKIIVLTNLEPDKVILDKILKFKPELYLVKSNVKLSELREKILNTIL